MSHNNNKDDVSRKLEGFLQQCTHFDKDQRYMAVSDMSNILSQNIRLDPTLEKKIGDCLCKLFDDKSVDVQSIAVKTVSVLVASKTCQEKTIVDVFTFLCKKMLTGDDLTIRNLYAIGLKTCIASVDDSSTVQLVCGKIAQNLISFAVQDQKTAEVQDTLEVLNDLLIKSRNTGGMERFHNDMIQMSVQQLKHNSNALVRKRAVTMLGYLSVLCSDAALTRLVEDVMKIGGTETVLAIGAIGREAGSRLAHYVDVLVPLLLKDLQSPDVEAMQNAMGDDHREFIFQALESFVVRCPNEMEKHLDTLLKEKCFVFLKYDPNWNDDDDDEMSDVEGDEEEEEDDDDAGYSDVGDDDDDSSWKVRRACAKLLHSLISSRSEAVNVYFAQLEHLLQDRSCKERVESVRLDVLDAYRALLDATVVSPATKLETTISTGPAVLVRQRSNMGEQLNQTSPSLIKNMTKLLKTTKQPKSKIAIVQTVSKVLFVLSGRGFDKPQIDALLPLVLQNLKDRNANLKLECLLLCKNLIVFDSTGVTAAHLQALKPPVLKCIDADWFRLVSEALKCVSCLCVRLTKLGEAKDGAQLLTAIMPRLRQADIDQEIKNCAIEAAGQILSCFTLAAEQEKQTLAILLDRVKNESSRLAALRAFERIALTVPPKQEFLQQACPALAVELVALLRQQSRDVRQHTLSCLIAMVQPPAQFQPTNLAAILTEVAQLIADGKDSHLCHLALDFITLVVKSVPQSKQQVNQHVLEKLLAVSTTAGGSAVLSGQAYSSLMQLFSTLATGGDFITLFQSLYKPSTDAVYWNTIASAGKSHLVAEACAVLIVGASPQDQKQTITAIVQGLQKNNAALTAYRHVELMLVGELGKRISLAEYKNVDVMLQDAFNNDEELIRVSAASSLGKLVVGDAPVYLPIVMQMLQASQSGQKKNHYLLLVSLKEVLSSKSAVRKEDLDTIFQMLQSKLNSSDEEVRNMIGECLGKLATLMPEVVFPTLVSTRNDTFNASWTKITAMRCAIVAEQHRDASKLLAQNFVPCVGPFLDSSTLDGTKREQTENCKAALFACHALIHHLPHVAVDVFTLPVSQSTTIMDLLFECTKVVPGLQKKVDFGPFKILVDDGLPIRKSAFSCLSSLLENQATCKLLGALNTGPLLPCTAAGAVDFPEDAPDVALICHHILTQVAARYPLAILAHSQLVLKSLQDTFTKIKYTPPVAAAAAMTSTSSSGGAKDDDPEGRERKLNIFRSALRTINAIALMPGAAEDRAVAEAITAVQKVDYLYKMSQEENLKSFTKKQ